MAYRTTSAQLASDRYGRDRPAERSAYDDDKQPQYIEPKKRARFPGGYTLGHGSWQVRVGPVAFWTLVGTLVIMGCWTVVTGTYFAFEDDVLTRLIARQADMQFAYEDRLADMRAQVDRVTSRQMLDQEQFEQKLEQLVRRQALLEQRTTSLTNIADPTPTGAIKPPATPAPAQKPAPLGDRGAQAEPRGISGIVARITGRTGGGGIEGTFARLQESLDRIDTKQSVSMSAMEESYESKARRMRTALSDLGIDVGKPTTEASGGPFVPARIDQMPFEKRMQRINLMRTQVDRLTHTLVSVPVRMPLESEIDLSSGFGVRTDPFNGRAAMHTGLDFHGDMGDAVHATAAGTVTTAGWSGGYGRMIEIDHGNGLATRYGHLSEIDVHVGQTIKIGQVIGHVGSTGRSTGPHLHYETRIDGEAVDPQRFLRAGTKLGLISN